LFETRFEFPQKTHGRGVLAGAKVGNGVAVRAGVGVADAAGFGVATCAWARAKKMTKPTRTHTLKKAIPDRIRMLESVCRSWMDLSFIAEVSTKQFVSGLSIGSIRCREIFYGCRSPAKLVDAVERTCQPAAF